MFSSLLRLKEGIFMAETFPHIPSHRVSSQLPLMNSSSLQSCGHYPVNFLYLWAVSNSKVLIQEQANTTS